MLDSVRRRLYKLLDFARSALPVAASVAILVWAWFTQGLITAVSLTVALAAVVVPVWNPWQKRPRIGVELRRLGGGQAVVGVRRPLDIERLVEDALAHARAEEPDERTGQGAVAMMVWAPVTREDRRLFAQRVEQYGKEVRSWVQRVDAYITEQSRQLVAQLRISNETRVDALNARVELHLPPDFRKAQMPMPPSEPGAPEFPRRPGPWGAASVLRPSLPISIPSNSLRAIASVMAGPPPRAPSYNRDADGGLLAAWPRLTVHHGEANLAGAPLAVSALAPGRHIIAATVTGENLPKPQHRQLTAEVRFAIEGAPVRAMDELRHVLREMDPFPAPDEDE